MMKKVYTMIIFLVFLFGFSSHINIVGAQNLSHTFDPTARVIEIVEERYEENDYNSLRIEYQSARVKILEGKFKGEIMIAVSEKYIPDSVNQPKDEFWIKENDKVVVQIAVFNGEIIKAEIMTHARDLSSILLISILIALLLLFGKRQGLKAVVTLGITLMLIFKFMFPRLFDGYPPIYLAIITGTIVTIVTFLMVSGITRKTIAATVGTVGGLASAAFISIVFSKIMRLTGYHSDDERILLSISNEISFDMKGILLAGILIGALGAIMDVAISIASSMEEVRKNNPTISNGELLKSGMNVGKDIMGTMANTLILAYVGAGLPLLMTLYGYESAISQVIHMEFLAVEILRTAAGSIGLILSIPITAFVTSLLIKSKRAKYARS